MLQKNLSCLNAVEMCIIRSVLKKAFQRHQDEHPTSNNKEVTAKTSYAFELQLCLIKAIENNGNSQSEL